MKTKNQMKSWLGLSLLLVSGVAFADVSEDFEIFENKTLTATPEVLSGDALWSGDGAVAAVDNSSALCDPQFNVHARVLSVEGNVLCTNAGAETSSNPSQVDFLVYVDETSEDAPSSDDMTGVQVALSTGALVEGGDSAEAKLLLYCTPKDGSVGWAEIGTISTGVWVRVNLIFDYEKGLCRVLKDGVPVTSPSIAADGGSWFTLATAPVADARKVSSLTFAGLAKIDDVVVSQKPLSGEGAYSPYPNTTKMATLAEGKEWSKVSANDLVRWNLDTVTAETKSPDDSGMLIVDKLELGYDPMVKTQVFKPTEMTMTEGGAAIVKFPKGNVDGTEFDFVAVDAVGEQLDGVTVEHHGESSTETSHGLKVTFTGTQKVSRFRIKATRKQPTQN